MFGLFKDKKDQKDQYFLDVAKILNGYFGKRLPIENAYALAKDCFLEYTKRVPSHLDQTPGYSYMALYSMSFLLEEMSNSEDKATIIKLVFYVQDLQEKLRSINEPNGVQQYILSYSDSVLPKNKSSIDSIKSKSVDIVLDIISNTGFQFSRDEITTLVDNVSRNAGDGEVLKVGAEILAFSSLVNCMGYFIDKRDILMSKVYYQSALDCFNGLIKPFLDSDFSEYQRSVVQITIDGLIELNREMKSIQNIS